MLRYVLGRLISAALTLVVLSALTFSLAFLAGDPAIAIAGKESSAAEIERVRQYYGFDRPVVVQYADWLRKAVTGDFGDSFHYQQSVSEMLSSRIPVTFGLGLAALLLALAVALPLGVAAAGKPGGLADKAAMALSTFAQAMPTFWFALLLIVFFSLTLRWLPVSGGGSLAHYVMPTVALSFFALPALIRLTRGGMLDALKSDYVRTARAKGVSRRTILFRHALLNAAIPLVSVAAVQLGALLGGSIVVEQIFALQGIGALSYDATLRADLPVVQAITLIVAAFYVLLTLAADLINAAIDPRIRANW